MTPVDETAEACGHLAAFASYLAGHGFTAQPLNLRVTDPDNGKTAVILCRPRPDDDGKLWFYTPGRWLAEADQPTWALTEVQGLMAHGDVHGVDAP